MAWRMPRCSKWARRTSFGNGGVSETTGESASTRAASSWAAVGRLHGHALGAGAVGGAQRCAVGAEHDHLGDLAAEGLERPGKQQRQAGLPLLHRDGQRRLSKVAREEHANDRLVLRGNLLTVGPEQTQAQAQIVDECLKESSS